MVFFSDIGMDTVSTAGEEVRDSRRTLPLAIFWCIAIVTTVYRLHGRLTQGTGGSNGRRSCANPSGPRSDTTPKRTCAPTKPHWSKPRSPDATHDRTRNRITSANCGCE